MQKEQKNLQTNMTGYDYQTTAERHAKTGLPQFRLNAKGQKLRVRLLSNPHRFFDSITERKTGEVKAKERFAWVAINKYREKEHNVYQLGIFVGSEQVYRAIRELAGNSDWGPPTQYDVIVERTEEFGRYYVVSPCPKKPLIETEMIIQAEGMKIRLADLFGDAELAETVNDDWQD
jgi:hypothetical protein